MSRPGEGTDHIQIQQPWTRHCIVGVMDSHTQPHCTQVGGTKEKISILCQSLLYFLHIPYVFKIKISVFQVMSLTKRQKGNLLEFCYGFNKASGFFIVKGPFA
jgi:hypothetical protein